VNCRLSPAVLVLLALPAVAQLKFTATHDGQPLPDAEVCFYHAEAADPRVSLFDGGLRCYPAGQVLDLPAKTYGWFARQGDRFITPHHGFLTGTGQPAPEVLERKVALSAAAQLDVSAIALGEDEHLAIIVGPTAKNRGATAPLDVAHGRALVPADTPITIARIRNKVPLWVSETMRVPPGTVYAPRTAQGSTALIWFRSDDPAPPPSTGACRFTHSAEYMELLIAQELPAVELVDAKGTIHRPAAVAENVAQLIDSMYAIHGAAPGPAVLRVLGGRFVPAELKIDVKPNAPQLVTEALKLEIGSAVVVSVADQHGLVPSATTCEGSGETDLTRREVHVWSCAEPFDTVKLTPALTQRCKRVESTTLGTDREVASFAGIPPGPALVTVTRAGHTTGLEAVTLVRGKTSEVALTAPEIYVAGRVTRGDAPVAAVVRFLTGTAATDPNTGEYVALLSALPGRSNVEVIACDDSFAYIHRPKAEVPPGPGYDLAIPPNELVIAVTDERTGKQLSGADVTAAVVSAADKPEDVLFLLPGTARETDYVVDSLPEGTVIRACADLQGYSSTCSAPVTVRRRAEHVTLRLVPLTGTGRVMAAGYSTIFWVRPDGTIVERKRVDEETGRFSYELIPRDEHVVLSGTAPLLVTRAFRRDPAGELQIEVPPAPQRQLRVTIADSSPQEKAVIGLWVDGLRVPVRALSAHQIARREPWFAVKGQPLLLREIYAAQGLAVAIGPDVDFITTSLEDPNLFAGKTPIPVSGEFTIP
jgi:hypothetical protein